MQILARHLDCPLWSLTACFTSWKVLLLLVAFLSPGPGYDTSASLSLPSDVNSPLRSLVEKLTSWDAIYYVKVASRGYQYEQEWAFGWGFTRLIALCTSVLRTVGLYHYDDLEGLVGVAIAHLAHLFSVLVLYKLTIAIFPSKTNALAYITGLLHVISPAGLFLSTPCAESSYALLSFAGILTFSQSFTAYGSGKNFWILLSGLLFGIATTFRSNGILNGLLLLEEAFRLALSFYKRPYSDTAFRLLSTGAAGVLTGAGLILPQFIAYSEYCGVSEFTRPWCENTLPSIYAFVQDYYWDNGLFRYWTFSNIPLFLLGAPMFAVLFTSSYWVLVLRETVTSSPKNGMGEQSKSFPKERLIPDTNLSVAHLQGASEQIISNLAVQQFLLALLTLVRAHVQIISRISSAYPVWMWYCASLLQDPKSTFIKILVRFMVIYALVQAVLYASFLPPA